MKKYYQTLAAIMMAVLITSCHNADNTQQNKTDTTASANMVQLTLVTKDIPFPVEAKTAPGNSQRLFIASLTGKIYILENGSVLPTPFLDLASKLEHKDSTPAVRGMYSMAFDPAFATNHKFYVSYNAPTTIDTNKCKLVISQFEARGDVADLSTEKRVIEIEGHSIFQDAGEITFGPDGLLYISVGDNGTPMKDRHAEDLSSYMGKLLRVDVHTLPYKIPGDNPFVHTKGAKPEIWAYGLRRLWRFGYDSIEHTFIGGDIGDKLEEEVDIITKGGNYGWPYMEGDTAKVGKDTIPANVIPPVLTYKRKDGICVIGGTYYRGNDIGFLKDKYVFADYNGSLFFITKDSEGKLAKEKISLDKKLDDPLIVNSCDAGPNNEIYLCGVVNTGKSTPGAVYKIVKHQAL